VSGGAPRKTILSRGRPSLWRHGDCRIWSMLLIPGNRHGPMPNSQILLQMLNWRSPSKTQCTQRMRGRRFGPPCGCSRRTSDSVGISCMQFTRCSTSPQPPLGKRVPCGDWLNLIRIDESGSRRARALTYRVSWFYVLNRPGLDVRTPSTFILPPKALSLQFWQQLMIALLS
jgi:hypothetical protein